jgi:hypothetical protein
MSLLGKILAVLNILAVIAFLIIGGMAYSKRQAWAYLGFRAELMSDGIPLDDKELDKEGYPRKDKLHEKTVAELFGGEPVHTQVKEVERVKGLLDAQIGAATDQRKKIGVYANILLPMATTPADREYLLSVQTYIADDKGYADLKATLARAMPPAVETFTAEVRQQNPPPRKLQFEKQLQQAVEDLPGDAKHRLVQAYLLKLAKSDAKLSEGDMGAREAGRLTTDESQRISKQLAAMRPAFNKAADAAETAAGATRNVTKEKDDAEKAYNEADAKWFEADIQYREAPTAQNLKARDDAYDARSRAQQALKEKTADADKQNSPRENAAAAFLATLRGEAPAKDAKDLPAKGKAATKIASYIDAVSDEVLALVLDDLEARYKSIFETALTGKAPGPDGGEMQLDVPERKMFIARVLFAAIEELFPEAVSKALAQVPGESIFDVKLGDNSEPFKRFFRVVGVRTGVDAVNYATDAVKAANDTLPGEMTEERNKFYNEHTDRIRRLMARAEVVDQLEKRRVRLLSQAEDQKALADFQIARVGKYRDELKTSRDKTDAEVKALKKLSDGLFEVRIAYRDAVRDQQKHLENIGVLEEQVLYLQKQIEAKERELKKKKTAKP